MNENAVYRVTKVIVDKTKKQNANGVLKEQFITIGYKDYNGESQRLKLCRIIFKSNDGKTYVFVTKNFKLSANQVAAIYKNRCMIELLFKSNRTFH